MPQSNLETNCDDLIVLRHVVDEGRLLPIAPLRLHLARLERRGLVRQVVDHYEPTALGKVVASLAPNDISHNPTIH
jgi:hypothetical protein